jgi:hypothetical protein
LALMPVSWWAGAPLLVGPVFLALVLGLRLELSAATVTVLRSVYGVAKGAQAVGGLCFLTQALPHAVEPAQALVGLPELKMLAMLLAFFLIDAILAVIFAPPRKGGQ